MFLRCVSTVRTEDVQVTATSLLDFAVPAAADRLLPLGRGSRVASLRFKRPCRTVHSSDWPAITVFDASLSRRWGTSLRYSQSTRVARPKSIFGGYRAWDGITMGYFSFRAPANFSRRKSADSGMLRSQDHIRCQLRDAINGSAGRWANSQPTSIHRSFWIGLNAFGDHR